MIEVDEPKKRRRTKANGEGEVWYEPDRKRWRGRITTGYNTDGKQVRKSVTAKTKAEATAKLRKVQHAADEGVELARADLTVGKYLDGWLDDVLAGTVRPATEQQYRDVVKLYIKPVLGQKRLRTMTPRDVARMVRFLATEYERKTKDEDGNPVLGVAPHTQRIARSVLRRALHDANREGQVTRNVASLARGVPIGASEGRTLTPHQARALLVAVDGHRLEAAFTVALALGLRLGELLGLAWPDIVLDGTKPRLSVQRALKRHAGRGVVLEETKTSTSRRTIYLPSNVASALVAHHARQAAERLQTGPEWEPLPLGADLVFRTPFGTAVDPANFRHATYKATALAGLGRWSPHELRHSAASLLLAQGISLKVVSELLGHSSIRVTADIYSHLLEPARQEAAEAMERALWGN
jgi:integrase